MNDAHHGLPGATFAEARYSSTCGPRVRAAVSRTPRWLLAMRQRRGAERAAAAAGRSDGRGADRGRRHGGGRGALRPGGWRAGPGPRRASLVAAAVLLGRALDVGDPLAEAVRVVDRLARRHPRLLDLLGVVQEPLDLQLRLLRVARVLALVPDPDAHLEEPDRVGVAEVEVLHARLDQRGHQRQLRRQAALLGLPGHPRRDLLLRRVVARVGVRARRRARRAASRRRAAAATAAAAGLRRLDGLQEHLRVAAAPCSASRGLGGDRLQEEPASPAWASACGCGRRGGAPAATGAAATAARRRPPARPRAPRPAGAAPARRGRLGAPSTATSCGRLPVAR